MLISPHHQQRSNQVFTGLIEQLGTVTEIVSAEDGLRLRIRCPEILIGAAIGDSVAVNGCCLTIVEQDGQEWLADVMAETLTKTTIGTLAVNDRVNLERAARLDSRLGGHIVQGHVDGVGHVVAREPSKSWERVTISLPPLLDQYLVSKGSITVDGISLTVADLNRGQFVVSLIPETLARTTLGWRKPGDSVNIEVDVLAKYVERILAVRSTARASDRVTEGVR
jgi:riboflavin synthase